MKILIVGGGGREHALAWKAAQSDQVELVYVAPGNAGTETENKIENVAISAEDINALKTFAAKEKINIQKRKSAWYLVSTETVAQKGQVSGWVSMLNVRFIATAKREGEFGVGALFSSVTNDSLPTVSTGVRGFDENDLKNAKADLKQLLLLNTYVVSTGAAARFAQQGKLQANKIKVKED